MALQATKSKTLLVMDVEDKFFFLGNVIQFRGLLYLLLGPAISKTKEGEILLQIVGKKSSIETTIECFPDLENNKTLEEIMVPKQLEHLKQKIESLRRVAVEKTTFSTKLFFELFAEEVDVQI